MRNPLTILIAVIVTVVLIVYMVTFQVRYDEVAVLTTFDNATPPTRNEAGVVTDPGSLKIEPGLYFKAPWPIQNVHPFSKKLRLLEDQPEETLTSDGYSVIVQMYVAWRIDDPYAFYRSLGKVERAEERLRPLMRDLKGVVSSYRFGQLVNNDPQQLRLAELEDRAAEQLRAMLAQNPAGYGIEIEEVGVRKLVLPEPTTAKVFDRMRQTRETAAAEARAQGEAEASRVRKQAETARSNILSFANRRADEIRNLGREEAWRLASVFNENPELAVFLDQIEALKQTLANNTTFILSAEDIGLKRLLETRLPTEPTAAPQQGAAAGSSGTVPASR